jgi:hypothetical protein
MVIRLAFQDPLQADPGLEEASGPELAEVSVQAADRVSGREKGVA